MRWDFTGEVIEWRGPAPFVFVVVPSECAEEIKAISHRASYGWGCIPASVTIGNTTYQTSLFPKNGTYYVPVKLAVQKSEQILLGNLVSITIEITNMSQKQY